MIRKNKPELPPNLVQVNEEHHCCELHYETGEECDPHQHKAPRSSGDRGTKKEARDNHRFQPLQGRCWQSRQGMCHYTCILFLIILYRIHVLVKKINLGDTICVLIMLAWLFSLSCAAYKRWKRTNSWHVFKMRTEDHWRFSLAGQSLSWASFESPSWGPLSG